MPAVQRLPLQGRLPLISLISLSSHILSSFFEVALGRGAGPGQGAGDRREPLLRTSFMLPHNLLRLASLERCSRVLSGTSPEERGARGSRGRAVRDEPGYRAVGVEGGSKGDASLLRVAVGAGGEWRRVVRPPCTWRELRLCGRSSECCGSMVSELSRDENSVAGVESTSRSKAWSGRECASTASSSRNSLSSPPTAHTQMAEHQMSSPNSSGHELTEHRTSEEWCGGVVPSEEWCECPPPRAGSTRGGITSSSAESITSEIARW
eukprot:scaffold68733_cov63-Phaeocystis_antarctica.AAC.7